MHCFLPNVWVVSKTLKVWKVYDSPHESLGSNDIRVHCKIKVAYKFFAYEKHRLKFFWRSKWILSNNNYACLSAESILKWN